MCTQKIFSLSLITMIVVLLSISSSISTGQILSPTQAQEAKRQLGTMTSDEIDQKIKSLGMTRAEAEKRAKENGIDLQAYLRSATGGTSSEGASSIQLLQSGPMKYGPIDSSKIQKQEIYKQSIGKTPTVNGLSYFGYDIFATTPASFEPNASGPIDADYMIGPDDVLRVSVWGQVEQQNELTVDKEGRIFIPSAGPVVVSGLTLDEINKTLTKQLSRSIQGLTASPKTVWLDVTLAKIRPKRIFIMGEVNNPGGYTVNSYANIFNSLFAVGGPTVNGSLREVRLIRGNKMVAKVDLYLYLTGSEKNNDIRVQNNDIIFIPVRKNSISIKGEIRRPGIYELLPGENLKKFIDYAGGSLPSTYLERVQIERIIPFKDRKKQEFEREFKDINFRDVISKNSDITLADGDTVTVFPILNEVKNFVTISGAVYKPGRYQLIPKMRISDLIALADSLKPETYSVRGELTRTEKDNRSRISIPFDVHSVMDENPQINIELQPKDVIVIHDIGITKIDSEFVDIYGSVKKPGRFLLTSNMTLTDVLMLAEGYSEDAWTLQAEISRLDKKKNVDTLAYIFFSNLPDLRDTSAINDFKYFEKSRTEDLHLKHRDKIFIRPNPNFRIQELVSIAGDVNFPGYYTLITQNEYLTEIIKRSGGITKSAYLRGGALYRMGERVSVDFFDAFNAPKTDKDLILHAGDSIYVPKKPNSIRVLGEVNNPGILSFSEVYDLWNYIDRTGGLTDSAAHVILFSPNGNAKKFGIGWFSGNSKVDDGSTIIVTKIPPPLVDRKELDLGNLIKDMFAIAASALTILVLAKSIK